MIQREKIAYEPVYVPVQAAAMGLVFVVGNHSQVHRCTATTGETFEDDDLFELHSVLEFTESTGAVVRSVAVKEVDPVSATSYGIFLGANNTQGEIVLAGWYAWEKKTTTTPLVGVERVTGFESKGK